MSDDIFNIFASIGIGLTFLASVGAIIVSLISLKASNKVAKRAGYLNTITVSRDKWSAALRENSSLYFAQISRLCGGKENDLVGIYNELTRYHFAISLHLFEQDKDLYDNMNTVLSKASEIVDLNNIIEQQYKKKGCSLGIVKPYLEKQDIVIQSRNKITELRHSILNEHQEAIFNGIRALIEIEWRKQQYEATDMWKEK